MDFLFLAHPTSVHTVRWVEGLRGRGHVVRVIANREPGPAGLPKMARWLRRQWQIRQAARRPGTVLVVQYVPAGLRALALLGIHPRIAVAWGSDVYLTTGGNPRRALRAFQQRLFLRGSDAVVAPSQDLARIAIARGARAERVTCVSFGTDLERFRPGPDPAPLRARFGLEGRRVILSPRTVSPVYNHPIVIEALARLPDDAVLVMSSHFAQPPEVAVVERRARELGLTDRLLILPPLAEADLPDLYRLAAVVVSVPDRDGGPATILETLATGRPIVATDVPGVREWLEPIDPAALVPVRDAAATARAIERALALTSDERAVLGRHERAVVEQRGDRQRALDVMEDLYRSLTRPRPRA